MKKAGKGGTFILSGVILAVIAAIVALLLLINRNYGDKTPPVVFPSAPVSTPAASGQDINSNSTLASVTPETVQSVLAALPRAASYSRTFTADTYYSGGQSSSFISVWVKGSSIRIVDVSETEIKNTLILDRQFWIWYDNSSGLFSGSVASADAGAIERYQRLIDYREVLELEDSEITDAGYIDFDGCWCIFAKYVTGELGYERTIYVSVDNGLLMGLEIRDGDALVYSMVSDTPNISTPEDEVFQLPDNIS